MSIKSTIQGTNGHQATVLRTGAVLVSVEDRPIVPIGTQNRIQYLGGKLGSDGLNSGVTNQAVNGSVTPQIFLVRATEEYDIYVTYVTIVVADGNISNKTFGSLSALTNGWSLRLIENGTQTYIIDHAVTCGEFILKSGGEVFGSGASSNLVSAWNPANDDAFIQKIALSALVPGGLRIGRGTLDRLESVVEDNLSSLTELTVFIHGNKVFE